MHTLYAAIRLFSLLTDCYVAYHAKGLRLQEEVEDTAVISKDEKVESQEGIRMSSLAKIVD